MILGDVLHSRVARSNIWSLTAAGADLWLCGPATLLRGFEGWAGRGAAAGRRFHVTSSVDEALRDADVVMALRIQRERMASGLLPSLREYAARYGLTSERLALARPGALVMHPGPMNEGRRDRGGRRRRDAVAHHRAGDERGRGPDGAALPSGRARLIPVRGSTGRRVADLDISRAWLVDPAAGREGPGDIVVRDGILESVTWLDGADAEGIDDRGVVVAPGFVDLHVHFREPGNEDAETIASGLAAAAHGGFTTVCLMPNTTPALDDPAVLARVTAAAGASGSPVRALAYGAVTSGRGGETLAALGELADAGVVGFSDDGSGVGSAELCPERARLRRRARAADRRPRRGRDPDRRRRGERRLRGDGSRAARLARRGGGGRGRAGPRDPRGGGPGRAGGAAPPDPRVDRRLARPGPAGKGGGPARDVRRHAASPRADRRMGRRLAALGVGGNAAIRGATARSRPRRTRARCASTRRSRSAGDAAACREALLDGTADAVATDHAPHTERRQGRRVRAGLERDQRASRRRSASLLAAVDAGLSRWRGRSSR